MIRNEDRSVLKPVAGCLLAAVVLAVLPQSAVDPLRDAVRAGFRPGQRLMTAARQSLDAGRRSAWHGLLSAELARRDEELRRLRENLEAAELDRRRARLELLAAQDRLTRIEQTGPSPFALRKSISPVRVEALDVRVVGREIIVGWQSRGLLDAGTGQGLRADQWVLDGPGPLILAGTAQAVATGLPVYAGRCVVGRIGQAGRWTSSLQQLTDAGFRARAFVLRSGPGGLRAGSEGLLEGTGENLCRLTQIPASEDVRPGDEVYAPASGPVDVPLLFGQVESARLEPGALHWQISVRPHVNPDQLHTVQVLIPGLVPDRLIEPRQLMGQR